MDGVAVARNVHYVLTADGIHYAAIITAVWNKETGLIGVVAFNEWGGTIPSTASVKYDPDGKAANSWHWPEKA